MSQIAVVGFNVNPVLANRQENAHSKGAAHFSIAAAQREGISNDASYFIVVLFILDVLQQRLDICDVLFAIGNIPARISLLDILDQKLIFESGKKVMAVFTSASTVKGFASACPDLDYSKVQAACIGRQTAAAASALGMQIHVSKEASMDSLVELICEVAAENK